MTAPKGFRISGPLLVFACLILSLPGPCYSQNKVMGEVDFVGATKLEQHSGVWIDGQYVGYISELKGARKVLLLPGEHQISVRHLGYKDFTQKIVVEPGQAQTVSVTLAKDPRAQLPAVTAEIKLEVVPDRAAVFVDGGFIGPVQDFGGMGRALLVSPGKHRIRIAMPGYRPFETDVNLLPNQKFTLKTELIKGSIKQAGPLIKKQ
ncbi:MAG: carboxypeptidase regulatory-like domain-containing protein [Terriglobia bacterium]